MFCRTLFGSLLAASVFAAASQAAPVMVDADWVQKHLDDPAVVLVDMAADDMQYQRFHLPGAVYLPYRALVRTRKKDGVSVRIDDAALYRLLGLLGIRADSHVVIYDDVGGLQAGRLFWELERIGHPKVSVLDGGLVQWILDGRPVTAEPVRPRPSVYRPLGGGRENEAVLADVRAAMAARDVVLLDVRSEEEYVGNPKSKQRTGHIPGARWWPWDASVGFRRGFRLKAVSELERSLAALGLTDKKTPVITYCRTGHRAAQSYLVLRRLGFENVKLYDGSMLEYARDPKAKLKLGRQP